jgi:hypothetical protein
MGSSKAPRAARVFIRQWLSELLVVNPQTLSMWINQGSLKSYEPEDVKDFLLAYPRALERASRGLEPIPGGGMRRPRPSRSGDGRTGRAVPAAKSRAVSAKKKTTAAKKAPRGKAAARPAKGSRTKSTRKS